MWRGRGERGNEKGGEETCKVMESDGEVKRVEEGGDR